MLASSGKTLVRVFVCTYSPADALHSRALIAFLSAVALFVYSVTLVAVVTGFGAVILSWWRSRPKKNAVAV